MRRHRRDGFTLVELLAVMAIIAILAGMIVAGAGMARKRSRIERTNAILNVLATGCERYWGTYHDYPYPDPDAVGLGDVLRESSSGDLYLEFWDGSNWTEKARNVALVYELSRPRQPRPFIDTLKPGFEKTDRGLHGPDGRTLFWAVDGFDKLIRVDRPVSDYEKGYIEFLSPGPDGEFGDSIPKYKKDNLEMRVSPTRG